MYEYQKVREVIERSESKTLLEQAARLAEEAARELLPKDADQQRAIEDLIAGLRFVSDQLSFQEEIV